MPAVPAPPNPLMEVLRRLGMTLPLPQSPEESALAKSGGVAQSIRDIGGLFKGLVMGPKMSGPADAQDLGGALTMLLPLLGKIVYHGSPHLFKKFDMSKVGTGEGAQAYGHGLYFADSPGVAKTYKALGDVDPRDTVNKIIRTLSGSGRATADDVYFEMKRYPDLAPFQNDGAIKRDILEAMTGVDASGYPSVSAVEAYRRLDKALPPKQGGALYDVDLPDEAIAKMLDWDAPLSQQAPDVQRALATQGFTDKRKSMMDVYRAQITRAAGTPDRAAKAWSIAEDMINGTRPAEGEFAHQHWRALESFAPGVNHDLIHDIRGLSESSGAEMYGTIGRPAEASTKLRELGVPGIKYLDGMSRGAGDGTRNYVVFDDELPKIVNVQR